MFEKDWVQIKIVVVVEFAPVEAKTGYCLVSKKMFLKNCGNKSIKSHFPIFSELSLSWWCFFAFEDTLFA